MRQRQLSKLLNRHRRLQWHKFSFLLFKSSKEPSMGQEWPASCKFWLTVPLMVHNRDCSVLAMLDVLLTLHWFELHRGCMIHKRLPTCACGW